ncbi:hypothetical protein ISS05_03895 [Candidatus Woesearchaeota archaeon]|nr:hypothetical protein [Candidatus Woesearchaeota archaeon]
MYKLLLVLLLLIPFASALSCDYVSVSDYETCSEIMEDSIKDSEKQQLTADLIYKGKDYANHSFVYDWNTNINLNSAPYGVETKSSGYIKDAWLKIIAVMPSVISEDKLLTSGIGKVLSAFNYKVEIPSGKESGDCKTEFSLVGNNNWLSVYLNDELIGTSTLTDFEGSHILNFKDNLRIQTVTEVKHYKTYRWCCGWDRSGGCKRYCEKCRYENTEHRVHEVNLEDTKQAEHYWPKIFPEIRAVDHYHNTTAGILNISDFDAFSLNFEDSYFRQFNYYYDVNVSLMPYDVFTLRANKFTKKESDNINTEQFNDTCKFYVSNPNGCKIRFYNHFHAWEQDCDLDSEFPEFSISTDKMIYSEDEMINVSVTPSDTILDIQYANEKISIKNKIQLKSIKNKNKITAYLDGRKREKIIHVRKKDSWDFVINFGVFSGVLYSIYFFMKKYWILM